MRQLIALLVLVLSVPASSQDNAQTLDQLERFMSSGRVEDGERLLREQLATEPENGMLRFYLAQVLDYDGRTQEAIEVLLAGAIGQTTTEDRVNLLMQAAGLHSRMAADGPSTQRRGAFVVAHPETRPKGELAAFRTAHLESAKRIYASVLAMVPGEPRVAAMMAQTLTDLGDGVGAITLWRSLLDASPNDNRVRTGLAQAYVRNEEPDVAIQLLEQGLASEPNDVPMLKLLSGLLEKIGDTSRAESVRERLAFSKRVPPFVEMEFSPQNVQLLNSLQDTGEVQKLFDDPSTRSSQLLAMYCWWHPHNKFEDRAFVVLGDRPDAVPLLQGLLDNATSSCTVGAAASALARSKPHGLLERLLPMLPRDRGVIGSDMDIANALDVLGDERAVPHLIAVLESSPQEHGPPMLSDPVAARERAALALGGFDTAESRQALEALVDDKSLGLACNAALYRMTSDSTFLTPLRRAVADGNPKAWPAVAKLATKLPGDQTVQGLLAQLREQPKEERKKQNTKSTGK
jgi:thioredoxin-like negative regulator of GroEL/HEAT repeat protein